MLTQLKETGGCPFATVILPHRTALTTYARRLTRNAADAEDLVQETLVRAYTRSDLLRSEDSAMPWLHTMMRNLFFNDWRNRRRQPNVAAVALDTLESVAGVTITDGQPSPEQTVLAKMEQAALLRAVSQLPDEYRDVILLADVEGLAYQDVADRLDVPVGTVRSRLFRARGRVARSVWAWRPDTDRTVH